MRAVVGHSQEVDERDVARDVIEQCREQLGGDRPKAALLFMSVDYDHAVVLQDIRSEWPDLPLIGGSSDGEVSTRGYAMDSVVLTLLCGDDIDARSVVAERLSEGIDRAADEIARALDPERVPALALTTFAPSTNASEVLRQLSDRIDDARCPVLGGLTGDHREFARMVEFHDDGVYRDSLPILFLYGDIAASWGIGSGWFPIGAAHEVTASDGHIVARIGDEPAIEAYRRHYGDVPEGSLGEYPLAVYSDGPEGPFSLRAVLGTNDETGEVRFAGEVPQGSHVRMTQVLSEGILSGTEASVRQALARYPGERPEVALLFTCAARKWVLGSAAEQEIGIARSSLAGEACEGLAFAGLYVYGEIAPPEPGVETTLHNETCVTVMLGKR